MIPNLLSDYKKLFLKRKCSCNYKHNVFDLVMCQQIPDKISSIAVNALLFKTCNDFIGIH